MLALARAHRWSRMLERGEVASISDLARRLDVDPSFIGRILRLTTLAPDINEAILQGQEPNGLSLAKLTKTLPEGWEVKWPRLSRQKMGVNKVDCGYLFQDVFKGGDVGGERGGEGGVFPPSPPRPLLPD